MSNPNAPVSLNVIASALDESCPVISQLFQGIAEGKAGAEEAYGAIHLLIAEGHHEAALELIQSHPDCADDDIAWHQELLDKQAETPIPPTRCRTFGCTEEQISVCHPKLIRNKEGKPSNTPAFHISPYKLETVQAMLQFREMTDEVLEQYYQGDNSAHLAEEYLQAVVKLKMINVQEYERLLADFKDRGIKISQFKSEVEKLAQTAIKPTNGKQFSASEIELPDHFKPYAEGLEDSSIFVNEDGGYSEVRETKSSVEIITHSNFLAKIDEVKVFDDGVNKNIHFSISGIANGESPLPNVTIESKNYSNMLWAIPHWGNQAIFFSNSSKDAVRFAIQITSKNAPEVVYHYQNGWDFDGKQYSYFFPDGVIGQSTKNTTDISELKGYGFESPDKIPPVLECYNAVKVFLDVSATPEAKGVPVFLLSFGLLSLLMEKLKAELIEIKFQGWLYGKTGSFKTAISLVLLNFFGTFTNPPATFADTIVSIERQLYLAKDALLILDDFHPAMSPSEKKAKEGLASKVIRMVGDRTGKRRAKSNLQMNKTYNPRGNVLITGEDIPSGHSTNSRLMAIELGFGDIDSGKLTYLQNNGHLLNGFTYHYIQHLSEAVYNCDGVSFKEEFLAYRDKASNENRHRRFAEAVALLHVSWNQLLKFFLKIEAISETEYQIMLDEGWQVFIKIAEAQNDIAQSQDDVSKYMSALREMITTKQIVSVDKSAPAHLASQGTMCYHDSDNYYLVPEVTYIKVKEFLDRKGEHLGIKDHMLRKMLADRNCIVKPTEDNRLATKIRVGIHQVRVLQIPKRILDMF